MIYTDLGQSIRRESDGAIIGKDLANRDYQEALKTGTINPKPAATKPEAKAAALAVANHDITAIITQIRKTNACAGQAQACSAASRSGARRSTCTRRDASSNRRR